MSFSKRVQPKYYVCNSSRSGSCRKKNRHNAVSSRCFCSSSCCSWLRSQTSLWLLWRSCVPEISPDPGTVFLSLHWSPALYQAYPGTGFGFWERSLGGTLQWQTRPVWRLKLWESPTSAVLCSPERFRDANTVQPKMRGYVLLHLPTLIVWSLQIHFIWICSQAFCIPMLTSCIFNLCVFVLL